LTHGTFRVFYRPTLAFSFGPSRQVPPVLFLTDHSSLTLCSGRYLRFSFFPALRAFSLPSIRRHQLDPTTTAPIPHFPPGFFSLPSTPRSPPFSYCFWPGNLSAIGCPPPMLGFPLCFRVSEVDWSNFFFALVYGLFVPHFFLWLRFSPAPGLHRLLAKPSRLVRFFSAFFSYQHVSYNVASTVSLPRPPFSVVLPYNPLPSFFFTRAAPRY